MLSHRVSTLTLPPPPSLQSLTASAALSGHYYLFPHPHFKVMAPPLHNHVSQLAQCQ